MVLSSELATPIVHVLVRVRACLCVCTVQRHTFLAASELINVWQAYVCSRIQNSQSAVVMYNI